MEIKVEIKAIDELGRGGWGGWGGGVGGGGGGGGGLIGDFKNRPPRQTAPRVARACDVPAQAGATRQRH